MSDIVKEARRACPYGCEEYILSTLEKCLGCRLADEVEAERRERADIDLLCRASGKECGVQKTENATLRARVQALESESAAKSRSIANVCAESDTLRAQVKALEEKLEKYIEISFHMGRVSTRLQKRADHETEKEKENEKRTG